MGVESATFFYKQTAVKSSNMHPASIHYAQNGELFKGRHNGADIVNWQVEKGGFGWK